MFENWEVAPFKWKMSPRAAVKRLGKVECWQILFVGCIVAGGFALVSLFWFLRAHYFNATNAGWGDPEQDRHQWLLGWGIRISASVALSCTVIIATRSRRALISIAKSIDRFHLLALCAWEICVVGSLLILVTLTGNLSWDKENVLFFSSLVVCGFVVVAAVAMIASSFGRPGGAITGLLCGLAPSVLIFLYAVIVRPGFEGSAAAAGVAMVLAIPSGIGGAVAGLISSWHNKT